MCDQILCILLVVEGGFVALVTVALCRRATLFRGQHHLRPAAAAAKLPRANIVGACWAAGF
jgi:hypothetical protein